jgi:hypothetical protein
MTARIIFSILLALSAGQAPQAPQAPWTGTWKLDPIRSTAGPDRYKRVITRIEPSGDGLKVTYEMVGTRGGVSHLEWAGKLDGKDYPVEGIDSVLTNAYTLLGDRSYRIVVKVEGVIAETAIVEVSADGKTLTSTTTRRGGVTTLSVYEKQ